MPAKRPNTECVSVVANWPLALCRYYLVDNDAGSDANVGYIDAAPGADLTGLTAAVALKTEERLREILPQLGAGRIAVVLWKARAGGANFLMKDGVTQDSADYSSLTGYGYFLRRGSLDLSNTVADKLHCGYINAVAGPNSDLSWTVGVGSTTGNIVIGAGTLPVESTFGLSTATGYRIRWLTGALAGTNTTVVARNGTTDITTGQLLASAPVSGDTFVIDKPGVRFKSYYDGTPAVFGLTGLPSTAYTAGVCVTNNVGQKGYAFSIPAGRAGLAGFECNGGAISTLMLVSQIISVFSTGSFYVDETSTFRTTGFGLRNTGSSNLSAVRLMTLDNFYETAAFRSFFNCTLSASVNRTGGGYHGAGPIFSVIGGNANPANLSGTSFGRTATTVPRCRVAGLGLAGFGPMAIQGVEFVECTTSPLIKPNGTGTVLRVDDCSSSGSNTDVCVDLTSAFLCAVSIGGFLANTFTASAGDIRVGAVSPQIFPMASLLVAQAKDKQGNNIIGTALQNACLTASLPAAAALPNGSQVIEDAGAGVRNTILYDNLQRFRFPGSAPF